MLKNTYLTSSGAWYHEPRPNSMACYYSETKPWTRWWWNGSQVTPKGLTAALEKYKQVGLGGTEVTVIYGVQNQEKEFINYLSPDWVKVFEHTLSESKRLGMGIDLANASGWPLVDLG
jgi:lipopolysaccharide biosynthesis glycosyltransferase